MLAADVVHVVAELQVVADHNGGSEAVVAEIAQAGDAEDRESGGEDVAGNIAAGNAGFRCHVLPVVDVQSAKVQTRPPGARFIGETGSKDVGFAGDDLMDGLLRGPGHAGTIADRRGRQEAGLVQIIVAGAVSDERRILLRERLVHLEVELVARDAADGVEEEIVRDSGTEIRKRKKFSRFRPDRIDSIRRDSVAGKCIPE